MKITAIFSFVLLFWLAACTPSQQVVEVTRPVLQTVDVTRQVEVTRIVTQTAALPTSPNRITTPIPSVTPESTTRLDLASVLRFFPLYPGTQWVYTEVDYTQASDPNQIIREVRLIEDQVIEVQNLQPYYFAHIQRKVSLVWADPNWEKYGTNINLGSSEFWYVIHDGRVYLSHVSPDSAKNLSINNLLEELDFPLEVGSSWCPNKIQHGSLTPVAETPVPCASAGARKVLAEKSYTTQAGSFDRCFQMSDFYNSGGTTQWFCYGIGIVAEGYDHGGTRAGYSKALVEFKQGETP